MPPKKKAATGPRLLLIDGHSMAFRAYFALPVENFTTNQGQPTNVLYGFSSMLTGLLQSEQPTHVAVAFDLSRKTFRSELYPEYKAQRSATPDEFKAQMDLLYELVNGFGIKYFTMEGFEADDIIATLAHQAQSECEVLICTGDRDAFQLVNEKITVLYPKKGVTELARMTPTAIVEKYGLTPQQYPDFAALRGDPSDNLPSLPGVGEKTATKWIVEHGNLTELLNNAEKITGKVGDSLRAGIEAVKLNRVLTQMRDDLPLETGLSDLEWPGINKKFLQDFYQRLEIRSLASRVSALPANEAEPAVEVNENDWEEFLGEVPQKFEERTAPTWEKEIKVSALSASGFSQLLKGNDEIAIDLKFEDSSAINPVLQSVAVSVDGYSAHEISISQFSEILASKKPLIVFSSKSLFHYLMENNLEIPQISLDLELAGYLLNPGTRHLEFRDLTGKYLGIEHEASELDLFSEFDPTQAALIYRVATILRWELEQRKLNGLLNEMELPVSQILAKLEVIGIKVDRKQLEKLEKTLSSAVEDATLAAHQAAGHEFNVNSPKQLQVILFDELGLPKTKKIKTGYTTDAESLQWLLEQTNHPVLQHLMRIREAGKLATTIRGLVDAIDHDGRIHTTLQQTVAATGRLSSINPNLQNIPVRTEEGRAIRSAFVVDKPYTKLLTADYSQIEMRIMAHLSNDKGLIAAFNSGEDLHSTVASLVFGVKPNEVDPEMRRQIKAMSYGLAYGLSTFGLSQQLNLTPGEAGALMNKYMERFGGIRDYLQAVVKEAKVNEFTETIFGRRRYLPDLFSDNRQRREAAERMALNAPIQGSAADIIKIAMIKVDEALSKAKLKSRMLLQVHDELIFEIFPGEEEELEELVRVGMASAADLSVPLAVNIGIGEDWDSAAH